MKTSEVQSIYSEYIMPTYAQLPVCLVKGKGSRVWDIENREYLDFFPGWGVSVLGHCHPDIVNAIKNQARKILHIPNNYLNLKQAQLAKVISENSFPAKSFFCNSGAEANEGAIKFARKYGESTGRFEIITMQKSFHGRTMGAMVATAQGKVQKGFEPLLQGFKYANFNDLESVKQAVNERSVAIFLEPVQGEGGINIASQEFMKGLRKICDENNMLLMLDEVQTGVGRTGKMFGYQHYGIEPDVLTLAKALGGGVPIGAFVVNHKANPDLMGPGLHGSTYGGNPLVTATSLAVFKVIKEKGLTKNAEEMGAYLVKKLGKLKKKYAEIAEVRNLGLMCALQLTVPGKPVVDAARENGLLINCTQENILRIMPAINVSKTLINKAVQILDRAFEAATAKESV